MCIVCCNCVHVCSSALMTNHSNNLYVVHVGTCRSTVPSAQLVVFITSVIRSWGAIPGHSLSFILMSVVTFQLWKWMISIGRLPKAKDLLSSELRCVTVYNSYVLMAITFNCVIFQFWSACLYGVSLSFTGQWESSHQLRLYCRGPHHSSGDLCLRVSGIHTTMLYIVCVTAR